MADQDNFSADLRAERIAGVPERETGNVLLIIAIFGLLAAIAGAGYYIYTTADFFNPYKQLYSRLGIDLPRSFEKHGQASAYLDQLSREPCDRRPFLALTKLMDEAGFPREGARSREAFNHDCTPSPDMLASAYDAYTRVGDHAAAIRVATTLIQFDGGNSQYHYWRAAASERSKDYKSALKDYLSALQLFPDLSRVASSEFYKVSLMYEKLDRPCDAIAPLETYISYNVKTRQTQQIAKLISDYSRRGSCTATYANGAARVLMPSDNVVEVTINGVLARMVVDTGATSVSLTPEMAARARITPDTSDIIGVKTVGGFMNQAGGYAQTIQVDKATAANVPVLIAVGSKDTFGTGIDGLLGMTYLSRFEATFSPGLFELKPRSRN